MGDGVEISLQQGYTKARIAMQQAGRDEGRRLMACRLVDGNTLYLREKTKFELAVEHVVEKGKASSYSWVRKIAAWAERRIGLSPEARKKHIQALTNAIDREYDTPPKIGSLTIGAFIFQNLSKGYGDLNKSDFDSIDYIRALVESKNLIQREADARLKSKPSEGSEKSDRAVLEDDWKDCDSAGTRAALANWRTRSKDYERLYEAVVKDLKEAGKEDLLNNRQIRVLDPAKLADKLLKDREDILRRGLDEQVFRDIRSAFAEVNIPAKNLAKLHDTHRLDTAINSNASRLLSLGQKISQMTISEQRAQFGACANNIQQRLDQAKETLYQVMALRENFEYDAGRREKLFFELKEHFVDLDSQLRMVQERENLVENRFDEHSVFSMGRTMPELPPINDGIDRSGHEFLSDYLMATYDLASALKSEQIWENNVSDSRFFPDEQLTLLELCPRVTDTTRLVEISTPFEVPKTLYKRPDVASIQCRSLDYVLREIRIANHKKMQDIERGIRRFDALPSDETLKHASECCITAIRSNEGLIQRLTEATRTTGGVLKAELQAEIDFLKEKACALQSLLVDIGRLWERYKSDVQDDTPLEMHLAHHFEDDDIELHTELRGPSPGASIQQVLGLHFDKGLENILPKASVLYAGFGDSEKEVDSDINAYNNALETLQRSVLNYEPDLESRGLTTISNIALSAMHYNHALRHRFIKICAGEPKHHTNRLIAKHEVLNEQYKVLEQLRDKVAGMLKSEVGMFSPQPDMDTDRTVYDWGVVNNIEGNPNISSGSTLVDANSGETDDTADDHHGET